MRHLEGKNCDDLRMKCTALPSRQTEVAANPVQFDVIALSFAKDNRIRNWKVRR